MHILQVPVLYHFDRVTKSCSSCEAPDKTKCEGMPTVFHSHRLKPSDVMIEHFVLASQTALKTLSS